MRKLGFVAAPAHVLATVRSVANPPNSRAPCASRALKLNSNALYPCVSAESLVMRYDAWVADAAVTSYMVIGVPSIGLNTVFAAKLGFVTTPFESVPGRRMLLRSITCFCSLWY